MRSGSGSSTCSCSSMRRAGSRPRSSTTCRPGPEQARTYADLDRLVADLPVPPPSAGVRQLATTANLARLGTDPEHRQTMTGGMSSYVRRGIWTVPAYLNLNAGMSTVEAGLPAGDLPARRRRHLGLRRRRRGRPRGARGLGGQHRPDRQGHRLGVEQGRHHPAHRQAAARPPRQLGGRRGEGPVPEPSRPLHDATQPQARRGRHPGRWSQHRQRIGHETVPGIRPATPQDSPPQDEANRRF